MSAMLSRPLSRSLSLVLPIPLPLSSSSSRLPYLANEQHRQPEIGGLVGWLAGRMADRRLSLADSMTERLCWQDGGLPGWWPCWWLLLLSCPLLRLASSSPIKDSIQLKFHK